MYIAIKKDNPTEYHSFYWTQDDQLLINGESVNPEEWEIVWVEQTLPC